MTKEINKLRNALSVTIFIFSVIIVSFANSEEFVEKYATSKEYDLCIQSVVATYDVLACMKTELARQDKVLNENYKKAIKALDKERRKTLISAQRSWINYRDKKCSLYYHKNSGAGGLLDQEECLIKETIKRSAELFEMF
jgi:uncharacterized protein YecT (DUF1311 family)